MRLLDFIFRRRKANSVTHTRQFDVRLELMRVVEEAILSIMLTSLGMMNVEAQKVPVTGGTGSLRSRGYLLGLTEAVIQEFAAMEPTQEEFVAAFAFAFATTYGPCDWGWALETIDQFQAENQEVLAGARLGRRDAQAVYSGQSWPVTTGFWLLNSGDEEAIRQNLAI